METLAKVFCPLIDNEIENIDCIENRDCINGIIKLSSMPDKYKGKRDYKTVCRECKYFNY